MRSFTVVSLNVGLGVRNGMPPLRERAAGLAAEVEASGADAVLLQEMWTPGAMRVMRARLTAYPHWVARNGLAIGARRPVGAPRFRRFAGVRAGHRSQVLRAGLGRWFRGLLTARTEDGILLGTTQLTSNRDGDWSAANRHFRMQRGQLAAVHEAMREAGPAALRVLGGDFNLASDGVLYPRIVDGGAWTDPFAGDERPTFRVDRLAPGSVAHRIDYLLLQGDFRVTDRRLLCSAERPLLTDHLAPLVSVARRG
ncbi:endonuclease/exonuclease/phosphatase family metal-dependent hydrolase [Actinoplanes octamycinicus]|uniref:Endonuclease/exonuclease/phosphatase family metal-dependent hydrolase n=1 Tax=Actinoplanes octamycinicus TaxID=135948 RepID=A0A7W7H6M1_9ACTN|nr:endonuclease/exonuclease/phosphatase family protein [Actinoplanes octamycinicus]MBB4744864.1 endonuclease/exonuclease/phosphatase family metal-dependent hydrolase [Actinoplanes octamycinicus]GIE55450.1 hypothetical protein Aoc01nite_08520 [Actinoplanes octamycinicus]